MIQSIIVDDELKNRESLFLMLKEYCPDVEVINMASSVSEAKKLILETRPQLVFLDVEMPPLTAFDLLKSLDRIDFEIIFVTAFNYYAVDAIKFSALYYILKPVKIEELQVAVARAKERLNLKVKYDTISYEVLFQDPEKLTKLVVNSQQDRHLIEIEKLIYIESENVYSIFYLEDGKKIMSSKPIIEYEKMLANYKFYRVHKSYLINLTKVVKVLNKTDVILSGNFQVPIAVRRRDEFTEIISKL